MKYHPCTHVKGHFDIKLNLQTQMATAVAMHPVQKKNKKKNCSAKPACVLQHYTEVQACIPGSECWLEL